MQAIWNTLNHNLVVAGSCAVATNPEHVPRLNDTPNLLFVSRMNDNTDSNTNKRNLVYA